MKSLDTSLSERNNLNAIRLVLALLVMLTHCFPLTGNGGSEPILRLSHGQASMGGLAVDLFFFISGLLITGSWFHCTSMSDYMRRRVLRIFPGYVAGLLFSCVAAAFFSPHPKENLFPFLSKAFLDIPSLGYKSTLGREIFPQNPFPQADNDSLWTISREFGCYLLVAAIGMFGLFKHRMWLTGIFAATFIFYCLQLLSGVNVTAMSSRFLTMFLAGSCAWLWRDKINLPWLPAIFCLALLLYAFGKPPLFSILVPLACGYLVLYAGFAHPIKPFGWCHKTDLSYGVYLFAFPLQQCVAYWGVRSPAEMFAITVPLVLFAAFLSWTLVEKPCLKLKSRQFTDFDPAYTVVPHPKQETPQTLVSTHQ